MKRLILPMLAFLAFSLSSCVLECDDYPCPDGYYCEEGFCYEDEWEEEELEPIPEVVHSDPCATLRCLHGAPCRSGRCDCPPGTSGTRCQIRTTSTFKSYYSPTFFSISGPDKALDIRVSDGVRPLHMALDLGFATVTATLAADLTSFRIHHQKVVHQTEGGFVTVSGSGTITRKEIKIAYTSHRDSGEKTSGSGNYY